MPHQSQSLLESISKLTHIVDDLERLALDLSALVPIGGDEPVCHLNIRIDALHEVIDTLNEMYEADLDAASEDRRAKWRLRDKGIVTS